MSNEVFATPIRQPVLYCKDCGHFLPRSVLCDFVYDPVWGKLQDFQGNEPYKVGRHGTSLNNPHVFREDRVFIETCGPEGKFFVKRGQDQIIADNAVSMHKMVDTAAEEFSTPIERKTTITIKTAREKTQIEKPKRGWWARTFLKEPDEYGLQDGMS